MKFTNTLIAIPALALALVISIANRTAVTFSVDPFSAEAPALAFAVPLYLLLFIALQIGVLIGGMSAWAGQTGWRKKARKTAREVKHLTKDLERQHAGGSQAGDPQTRISGTAEPENAPEKSTQAQKRIA